MDEEQQLKLANRISEGLPEVTRSEWMRWAQVAQDYGLDRAIELAGKLGNDNTLRPAIKRSNQLIAKTMGQFTRDLSVLRAIERDNVIGYISRILMVKAASDAQKRRGRSNYEKY
jgi:hypothetical protein